ncbi:MAG: putative rane protein [Proteobacteria bacterium]|nr:putative rane protein [Pseudomonadota bacterium]
MTLVLVLASCIGLILGLLGGGGSILAVPLLVYLHGMDAKVAIATALVMVAVTSLTAMIGHATAGRVCWKTGLVFASAGMLGAYGGGRLAAHVPAGLLLLLFGGVMLATAYAMMRKREDTTAGESSAGSICPAHLPLCAILLDGLLVGGITGLVGAGGGFLIVPALNILGRLPMHAAVGTSLLVLTLNSSAALAGYVHHVQIDWTLTAAVTAAAVAGSLLGGILSRRISASRLRGAFGIFVLAVAIYVLSRELTADLVGEISALIQAHPDFLGGMATMLGLALGYRLLVWVHGKALRPPRGFGPEGTPLSLRKVPRH